MSIQVAIIGAGGHGNDIKALLPKCNNFFDKPYFVGYLDDDIEKQRRDDVVGPISFYTKLMSDYGPDLYYVIGVNDPFVRRKIANYMDSIHAQPTSLVHGTAIVGPNCYIGKGSVLGPYSVLTVDVNIGRHVHLNTGASVNQNSVLGDYCTLSPGAKVCGDVKIGHTTYLGANSTVINMKNVGNNVTIGAGGVVVKDIPNDVIAVGVPAKVIKEKEVV